jgi:hypothetical protein
MKKNLITLILLLLAVAAGVVGGEWWYVWKPAELVRARVRAVLKDPDSAQFRSPTYYPKSGAGCGFVNARNSMGGYVGYTAFIAFPDGEVRFDTDDSSPSDPSAKLEALQKKHNFITLFDANCGEGPPKPGP